MNVLAIMPGFIPSTIIGVLRPLSALERKGELKLRIRHSNVSFLLAKDMNWCDVAVFCRNCSSKDLASLYDLKRRGKKVVYEIDDNFEEIPLNTDIGVYHRAFFRLHVLRRFFLLSDMVRVYSARMEQRSMAYGACVQRTRSYFDKSLIDGLSKKGPDGVIRIAYPTGRIDDSELEERIFSAIRTVLERHGEGVEFHLWRKDVPKQLAGVRGVVLNSAVRGYEKFIRSFYEAGYDIGLAPGVDAPFFHSKTNNKYREFGGCGVAGVYSNFLPYADSVIDGHSGILVGSSQQEWVDAVERLLMDDNTRQQIIFNAARDVELNYSFDRAVQSWRECLAAAQENVDELPDWLPPQSQSFSNFSFVCLTPKSKVGRRYRAFKLASTYLRGVVHKFSHASDYCNSTFRKVCCSTTFLVGNCNDLATVAQLLPLSASAVVDLTSYRDQSDVAIHFLLASCSSVPVSFLIRADQKVDSASLKDCVLMTEGQSESSLMQEFSLDGYPAAYLDLLERHLRYAPIKGKHANPVSRLCAKAIRGYSGRYAIWRGRLDTLSSLVKSRIGFREF